MDTIQSCPNKEEFMQWVNNLTRFSHNLTRIEEHDNYLGRESIELRIDTSRHWYTIYAHWPDEKRHSQLGAVAHTFNGYGNDLFDGPLSIYTWNAIMNDIIAYEMIDDPVDQDFQRIFQLPSNDIEQTLLILYNQFAEHKTPITEHTNRAKFTDWLTENMNKQLPVNPTLSNKNHITLLKSCLEEAQTRVTENKE